MCLWENCSLYHHHHLQLLASYILGCRAMTVPQSLGRQKQYKEILMHPARNMGANMRDRYGADTTLISFSTSPFLLLATMLVQACVSTAWDYSNCLPSGHCFSLVSPSPHNAPFASRVIFTSTCFLLTGWTLNFQRGHTGPMKQVPGPWNTLPWKSPLLQASVRADFFFFGQKYCFFSPRGAELLPSFRCSFSGVPTAPLSLLVTTGLFPAGHSFREGQGGSLVLQGRYQFLPLPFDCRKSLTLK